MDEWFSWKEKRFVFLRVAETLKEIDSTLSIYNKHEPDVIRPPTLKKKKNAKRLYFYYFQLFSLWSIWMLL